MINIDADPANADWLKQPSREYVQDGERLHGYVERFFERSGRTEWPTVRECARSLRWRQARVLQHVEDHPKLDTTYYYTTGYALGRVPDGDLFVESYGK